MNAAGEELLHIRVYTQKLLRTEAFTLKGVAQKTLYTEWPLHAAASTQRNLYTKFLHREVFAQRNSYTQKFLHPDALHRGAFARSEKLKLAAVLEEKPFAEAFGNKPSPLAPKVPIQWILSKKHKEYISETGLYTEPIAC